MAPHCTGKADAERFWASALQVRFEGLAVCWSGAFMYATCSCARQNCYAERLIEPIWRERLDHVVVLEDVHWWLRQAWESEPKSCHSSVKIIEADR